MLPSKSKYPPLPNIPFKRANTATAADSQAQRNLRNIQNRFQLSPAQERALAKYAKQFEDSVTALSRAPYFTRWFIWMGLAEVAISYAILAFAANNIMFRDVTGGPAASGLLGTIVVANSVGLNVQINRGIFTNRMSQIYLAVRAFIENETSPLNNLGRLGFDLLRFSVGIVASLIYALPFWISVRDDSPVSTTDNLTLNTFSNGFFATVAALAIPTRALLVLSSFVKLTDLLAPNGRRSYVRRTQAEIVARLDVFKKWIDDKELVKNEDKRNNQKLWRALNELQQVMNIIQEKTQALARQQKLISRLRQGGYGAVAETATPEQLSQELFEAWQSLGAIIDVYPNPLLNGKVRKTIGGQALPITIAASITLTQQLIGFMTQIVALLRKDWKFTVYTIITYMLSITIAAGYIYAQANKTSAGVNDVFGLSADNALHQILVGGALCAAGIFSAHWTYLAFEKMYSLWNKEPGWNNDKETYKRQLFIAVFAVVSTAAPAIAIAGSQAGLLFLFASGLAGALMNFVGEHSLVAMLFKKAEEPAATRDKADVQVHKGTSNKLGGLLNGIIDALQAQLAGEYAVSGKNVMAIGQAWNITVIDSDRDAEAMRAGANSLCCAESSCTCCHPAGAHARTATPAPVVPTALLSMNSNDALHTPLLSDPNNAAASPSNAERSVSTAGYVAIAFAAAEFKGRDLPGLTHKSMRLADIIKNMAMAGETMQSPVFTGNSPAGGVKGQSAGVPPLLPNGRLTPPSIEEAGAGTGLGTRPRSNSIGVVRRPTGVAPVIGMTLLATRNGSPIRQASFRRGDGADAQGSGTALSITVPGSPAEVFASPMGPSTGAAGVLRLIAGADAPTLKIIDDGIKQRRRQLTGHTQLADRTPSPT